MYDVIIVGGGFSGIHCASELVRMDPALRVIVMEASDRVGGRARSVVAPTISTESESGSQQVIDLGAHYFGKKHRRVMALARRFLSEDEIYSHIPNFGENPAFRLLLDGEWKVSTREESFFQIQGLTRRSPLVDRIRIFESLAFYVMLEAWINVREPWETPFASWLDSLNVSDWVRAQRMPRWINEMWDLGCTGLLSAAPEQISLLYWAWYHASNDGFLNLVNDFSGGPQEFGVRPGLGGLIQRYASALTCEIRLNTPVTLIEHDAPDRVRVTCADKTTLVARRVVVAASPGAVGRCIDFTPALSERRQALHDQPMGHAAKVVFVYERPWWRDSLGHHFIGYGGGAYSMGAEWALDVSAPGEEHYQLMAFVHPALLERARAAAGDGASTRERLHAVLSAEVVRLTGDPRAREYTHALSVNWGDDRYVGGGPNTIMGRNILSRLGPVWSQAEAPHGRLYFTGAEYSTEFTGYVEGALAAAEFTSTQVFNDIKVEDGARRSTRPARRGRRAKPVVAVAAAAAYATLVPLAWAVGRLGRLRFKRAPVAGRAYTPRASA